MKRSVQGYLKEWKRALMIEIDHLKEHGGERHILRDGRLLVRGQDEFIYLFHLSSDLYLPDGAPVRFVFQGEEDKGEVVATEGEELMLKLSLYIGGVVEEIHIYSEPWELLESLVARLDEAAESKQKRARMKRLISGEAPVKHTEKHVENPLHEVILRSHYNAITYIWGPPGTGKTYTLARIVASHYRKGRKVLVLAHSNAAVDVLMLAFASYAEEKKLFKPGAVIRYGASRSEQIKAHSSLLSSKLVETENPHLAHKREFLEEERKRLAYGNAHQLARVDEQLQHVRSALAELEKELIERGKVVGVTLSKAATDRVIYEQEYDLIVVDEMSMAYVPQIAFAASLGKRTVVCGDFKQLPPIAMSEHAYVNQWLKEDLFHQAGIAERTEKGSEHPHLFMLTRQRRMHERIAAFTNQYIYEGKVSNHPSVRTKQNIARHLPFPNEAAVLLNMEEIGAFALKDISTDSRFNLLSALLAVSYMIRAQKGGMTSIGYVTPYKAQARLVSSIVRELLPGKGILAATVHKFQGSECDMMIFDLVDSFPQSRPGVLLTDKKGDRLVNVAMTRARGKLLVMADAEYMKGRVPKERAISKMMGHFLEQGNIYEPNEYLSQLIQDKHLVWYKAIDIEQWKKDVKNVKKSIFVCVPHASQVSKDEWKLLNEAKGTLTILTKEPSSVPINRANVISSQNPLTFSIMDEKICWINQPYTNLSFPSARLYAPDSIDLLIGYMDWTSSGIEEKQENLSIKAGKTDYPLSKYLDIWERCPECNSRREAEVTAKGKVRLLCHYCGNTGGVTRFILERYIQYADIRCAPCGKELESISENGHVYAKCPRCQKTVQPRQLFE
ncbi:KaiC/GvpD/RAD55 family RecA-like ATPase/DNA-directed RNA polymerase subunit RPC12/RpoP [Bacillus fengqiuensis]|nr:KaiC/GvpD/RAD55 family RecA-like ATPase/DNA-directed RNA polymerase subunit RPC12/RpoP [Bacillus fengqiuensis]